MNKQSLFQYPSLNLYLPIVAEFADPKSKQYRDKSRAIQNKLKVNFKL